ncbi:MAG: ribosomal RNA small subunit methyltransferase A [Ignavibacteria bacterium GWB2_35_6b]|nr:MAG: ribosomal RNA small subunit methyltransferase A [Ignavibacteria bacterium GWB2_35_6b]
MTLHKPLKKYGQNYLVDNNIIDKIVKEFDIKKNDKVLEIGPGEGALTSKLIKLTNNLTIVEIDARKIEMLKAKFSAAEIINEDFLTINLHVFFENEVINVIGNIPYNITSPIFYKLIENRKNISQALLMVQYEVAKKITAEKGTKDYGILNVILNYFCDVKFCFKISPNVFYPKPKVFSAIINLKFDKSLNTNIDEELFINLVKSSFGNRRKNLKNSLSNTIFGNYDFAEADEYLKLRAEQLDVGDFIKLTQIAQKQYG